MLRLLLVAAATAAVAAAEARGRSSLVDQSYANTHAGYTPMLPEQRGGGLGDVYDFANLISHDRTSRSFKQRGAARQQELLQQTQKEPGLLFCLCSISFYLDFVVYKSSLSIGTRITI